MTKRKTKREPSTLERLTRARNKTLGIFEPEIPGGLQQRADFMNDLLDSGVDPRDDTPHRIARREAQQEDGDDGDE